MRGKMRPIGLDRKSKDYLNTLNIDTHYFEERFIPIETLIKANLAFKTKLENFKQFIDCLSADRCFALWIHYWSFSATSTKKANVYEKLLKRWMSRNTMVFKYDRVGNDFYVYVENNFNE